MIELPPDLMTALQAEADRQGKTVSEIASEAIQEWLDPTPWFELDGEETPTSTDSDLEQEPEKIVLPKAGETYIATKCENLPIRVKAVKPYPGAKPIPIPHFVTIEFPSGEDGQEWGEDTIHDVVWATLVESTGLTLESASDAGFTRVPKG